MNIVVWARVSSREQREGYSIDAQLRAARHKASQSGWTIAHEFVVAESARRGAERLAFNEMLKWVRTNARRMKINAILSHKLDRICRNMRDAVRLQELDDQCGVELAFVDNQFGPGAAGVLSFNVMAAVAQYYSDNLRSEVLKGLDEKVRQGWPIGGAPYGYMNVSGDGEEPIQPHPEKSLTVVRIFDLYAQGDMTFRSLAETLHREGHTYRPSEPRFNRTALSYILNNRFYIGEIVRNGQVFPGRYRPIISRDIFDACQDVLRGRNRRLTRPNLPLAGGLIRCAHCGFAITGERIRRRLRGGTVNEHHYYRCGNNAPPPDHPTVRWKASDLEAAIAEDLASLRFDSPEIRDLVRRTLAEAFHDLAEHQRRQYALLAKRRAELANMQDRLLNAYLAGTIDEALHKSKSEELRQDMARLDEAMEGQAPGEADTNDIALRLFDWCQNAAENWLGSTSTARREILDAVSLNRRLGADSLEISKRKPFDVLAEGSVLERSRGDRI
jgi:site-specific DNA recombinase